MAQNNNTMIVSVGGGPLAALYGTPELSWRQFLDQIIGTFKYSGASALEIICVDPNTDFPHTQDLDPHEKGFKNPDYRGKGWNAKLYNESQYPANTLVASFHEYCGSNSTNLNAGIWRKGMDNFYQRLAIRRLKKAFHGFNVVINTYRKSSREGPVPEDLVKKTRAHPVNAFFLKEAFVFSLSAAAIGLYGIAVHIDPGIYLPAIAYLPPATRAISALNHFLKGRRTQASFALSNAAMQAGLGYYVQHH